MRLALRTIGTWMFALAIILVVIDGTRSLAADRLVLTSLAESWTALSPAGFSAARAFIGSRALGSILLPMFDALVGMPGFAVLGVPGLVLAFVGRTRRTRRLVGTDAV